MQRTIDYGIDLGTTNSAIARQEGLKSEVLGGQEDNLVPSVVHIDVTGNIKVGKAAAVLRFNDPANTATEFKRLMGTDHSVLFHASGRKLSPVELSAEVLKHLRLLAEQHTGQAVEAAVITIPAMFQLPQCEATRQASQLAGLQYVPLLQEPIAAAIASVGNAELREGYWLIYDLGGGTFDVSLVRSRGGRLQVLDHDGDNHLGGKDFDRLIARKAVEFIRSQQGSEGFRRGDESLAPSFTRLRVEAERVRMSLSRTDREDFHVPDLAINGHGDHLDVRFSLDREELESLLRPIIIRTVTLCRQILNRNALTAATLNRLVLVGGPTLTPCLPPILETELGVEARHYVDPSRAVALGAATYATAQKIPKEYREKLRKTADAVALEVELSYESMTNDLKPLVAGRLIGQRESASWQVQLVSVGGDFRGSPTSVRQDGAFVTQAELTPYSLNVIEVQVYRDGVRVSVEGGQFSIIHGTTIAKPLLSQSVGVLLSDNSVRWYLRKGAVLPTRETVSHATTIALRRGQTGDAVHVPLIQGESELGDRNTVVGMLQIRAENLPFDLPIGSEVVVTLSVDEHSTTSAEAYVPLLQRTFREIVKFGIETRSSDEILQGLSSQRNRLAELEKLADELEDTPETDLDDSVRLIEELIEEGGADELNQADQMLHKVTSFLDTMETNDKKGSLDQQFTRVSQSIGELLSKDDPERVRQQKALKVEFQNAMDRADYRLAEAKLNAAHTLEWTLMQEQPGFWQAWFEYLSKAVLQTERAAEGRVLIDQGKVAISRNDLRALVQVCIQLTALLPREQQPAQLSQILSHVA